MGQFITIEDNTTEYDSASLENYLNKVIEGVLAYNKSLPSNNWRYSQVPECTSISVFEYGSGNADSPVKLREQRAHTLNRLSVARPSVVHGSSPMAQLSAGVGDHDFPSVFYESLAIRASQMVKLASRWDSSLKNGSDIWTHVQKATKGIRVTAKSEPQIKPKDARVLKRKANAKASLERSSRCIQWSMPAATSRVLSDMWEIDRMVKFQKQLLCLGEPQAAAFTEARETALAEIKKMIEFLERGMDQLKLDSTITGEEDDQE